MPNLRREIKAQYRQSRGRAEDMQRTQINGMGARCGISPSPLVRSSSIPPLLPALRSELLFYLFKQPLPRCSQPCHAWRRCKPHVRSPRRICRSPLIIDVFLSYSSHFQRDLITTSPPGTNQQTLSGRVIWDSVSHVSHLGVPSKLFLMNPASSLHISSKYPSSTHFHPGDSSPGPF